MEADDYFQGLQRDEYQFAELRIVGEPNQIIKGKYCEVRCYRLSKRDEVSTWHFAPYTVVVGSQFNPSSDEERIAHAIAKMPNADYFVNFTSFDQLAHWVAFRDYSTKLALYFWSEVNNQNAYLLKELKTGNIDQFSYEYGRAEAQMYRSLWEILKIREKYIESIFKNNWEYPFESVHELLIEIIKEDLEGEFIACLKRRFIYKSSEIKQLAKLKRKEHKGSISVDEQKKMYKLIDKYAPLAVWLNRLLLVIQYLVQNDPLIDKYFKAYLQSLDTLAKLQIQRDCNPKLKHHVMTSHTWDKGKFRKEVLPWNA